MSKEEKSNQSKPKKTIYEFFDDFLKTTIIEKKSYFDDNILIDGAIDGLIYVYIVNGLSDEDYKNEYKKITKPDQDKINKEKTTFFKKSRLQIEILSQKINPKPDLQKLKHLFASILWLRYMPIVDTKETTKKEIVKNWIEKDVEFPKPIASYSMAQMQIDSDVSHLICLFKYLLSKTFDGNIDNQKKLEDLKKYIIDWILDNKIEGKEKGCKTNFIKENKLEKRIKVSTKPPICNILLNLCDSENYEPIASNGIKEKIVSGIEKICIDSATNASENQFSINDWKIKTIDEKISTIRNKIDNIIGSETKHRYEFYSPSLKLIWSGFGDERGISPLSALEYKKAIVLYGPPGTSKTYSANKLATFLLLDTDSKEGLYKYLKKIVEDLNNDSYLNEKDYLSKILNKEEKDRIYSLQLHPNYTYEDFIWGHHIAENKTVAKKGSFLKLIDKINNDNKNENDTTKWKKYVLILDEINRIDLSRLFGELFSCIENRGEVVKLSIKLEDDKSDSDVSSINIPKNLYVIGTMNEIDFSLERVDFALRRRFVWFFHGFNSETLAKILGDNADLDFISSCEALNKEIEKHPDLGKQYQIGHTFFAEINKIEAKAYSSRAKEVLWNISIKPMLEAYLGNMKQEERDKLLVPTKEGKNFADVFLKNRIIEDLDNTIDIYSDEQEEEKE